MPPTSSVARSVLPRRDRVAAASRASSARKLPSASRIRCGRAITVEASTRRPTRAPSSRSHGGVIAARPHQVRTLGAGCGLAPPPGQRPRTGRRPGAARSPATTAHDTACPPSQDHMTSLARTNRFYYLRNAEHGNSSHPSRRASKSGDLLSAASRAGLRHVFSTANRCRPMLTSTSRITQGHARHTPASPSNGRIRRVSRRFGGSACGWATMLRVSRRCSSAGRAAVL